MIKSHDTLLLLFYMSAMSGHPLAKDLATPSDEAAKEKILHRFGLSIEHDYLLENVIPDYSFSTVGEHLNLSKAEIHRSHRRLEKAGLIRVVEDRPYAAGQWVNLFNAWEWLAYAVRYVYPAQKEGYGFGLPTGFNCPLIVETEMVPPDPPLVLAGASAYPVHDANGIIITPLDIRVTHGVQLFPRFYELIAIVDAIRIGGPREINHARDVLKNKIALINDIQKLLFQ